MTRPGRETLPIERRTESALADSEASGTRKGHRARADDNSCALLEQFRRRNAIQFPEKARPGSDGARARSLVSSPSEPTARFRS